MWIEVHDTLPDHQKVACVSDALGVSETQVIGMLVCIWTWALSNRPEGKLSSVDKRIVERAARWEGAPGELFAALLDAAWIDCSDGDTYGIHDWGDYAGRLIEKRAQAVARAQRSRERCANVARSVRERCACTVPNLTVPNQTKEIPPSESSNELSSPQGEAAKVKKKPKSQATESFATFWKAYPKKVAKAEALKAWAKIEDVDAKLSDILAGLERAKRSQQWMKDGGQFIPYPATWLNQMRWEDEYGTTAQRSLPPGYELN